MKPMVRGVQEYLGLLTPSELNLSRLKTHHKQIIIMHLQGMDTRTISDQLGYDPSHIRSVLQSKLAKTAIDDFFAFQDMELLALDSIAIGILRDAMGEDQEMRIRVDVAKFLMKNKLETKAKENATETAEDYVKRIMEFRIVEERGVRPAEVTRGEPILIEGEVI